MEARIALSLALVGAVAAACAPARQELTSAQRAAIADSVKAVHRALWASISTRNADSVMSFFSGDLTFADAGMVYPSRDSVTRMARAEFARLRADTLTSSEPKVMVLGPDAAVLTVTWHDVTVDTAGATHRMDGAWSAVYVRTAGGWKIVQAHESLPLPTPEPAPAARRRT